MQRQHSALPRSLVSPFDSYSPFHPAPDNTTIGSNVLTCFSQSFMNVIWPYAFCSQKECMLCAFSGVISGRLSVKLLQCTHLMSAKLEGNGQMLQRFQQNHSYFCCFTFKIKPLQKMDEEIQANKQSNCFSNMFLHGFKIYKYGKIKTIP